LSYVGSRLVGWQHLREDHQHLRQARGAAFKQSDYTKAIPKGEASNRQLNCSRAKGSTGGSLAGFIIIVKHDKCNEISTIPS